MQLPDEFAPLNNLPFFPGGRNALLTYFDSCGLYPQQARLNGVEGSVHVRFWVQSDGHLTHIQVLESRGPLLDSAAIRAVALMPRWYPAHQDGRAVACPTRLSIKFQFDGTYSSTSPSMIP